LKFATKEGATVKMSKNEIVFYFGVGIATLINEIGTQFGFAVCTFIPSMLIILWLGYKLFPTLPDE
jgi:hypothetical protein